MDPATGDYYPTVFFNEFWLLRDKLIALNETVEELPLNLEVGPISMTKWQLFLQIEQSFQVHRSYGSMLEGEADELKVHKCTHTLNCSYLNADIFLICCPLFFLFLIFFYWDQIPLHPFILFEVPLMCTITCSLYPWDVWFLSLLFYRVSQQLTLDLYLYIAEGFPWRKSLSSRIDHGCFSVTLSVWFLGLQKRYVHFF